MGQPLWKTVWQLLKQLHRVTVCSSNFTPTHIRRNENMCPYHNLYRITKPKGENNPDGHQRMNGYKKWSFHTLEHHSATKRSEAPTLYNTGGP